MFLSNRQLDGLAELARRPRRHQGVFQGQRQQSGLKRSPTPATPSTSPCSDPWSPTVDINVDAAAQVAHAISVHAVENEFDYYTAVDDRNPDSETGAGMIGTIEFNAATPLPLRALDVDLLRKNLGEGLREDELHRTATPCR